MLGTIGLLIEIVYAFRYNNLVDTTRISLLHIIQNGGDEESWREFVTIYRPLLMKYARVWHLPPEDQEDVAQHCLEAIVKHIENFEHNGEKGHFRRWLRTITNNHIRNLNRKRRETQGDTNTFRRPQNRERSPKETWEALWFESHLKVCLNLVRQEVRQHTYDAFHLTTIEQMPVEQVCQHLDLTPNQVYIARSRITSRLKQMMDY